MYRHFSAGRRSQGVRGHRPSSVFLMHSLFRADRRSSDASLSPAQSLLAWRRRSSATTCGRRRPGCGWRWRRPRTRSWVRTQPWKLNQNYDSEVGVLRAVGTHALGAAGPCADCAHASGCAHIPITQLGVSLKWVGRLALAPTAHMLLGAHILVAWYASPAAAQVTTRLAPHTHPVI